MKVTGKIKSEHELDIVCDHLYNINRVLVTSQQSPELSLYKFNPGCITTFETLWDKLQNLLGLKVATDVSLLFL